MPNLDPVAKAKAEAVAGHDLARFWDGFANLEGAEIARDRMDHALDQLLELGFGKTSSGQAPATL